MFKARAHRRDDGHYDLSFGKGSKKLTDTLIQQPPGVWYARHITGRSKQSVMDSWETWAAGEYITSREKPASAGAPDELHSSPAPDHGSTEDDELNDWDRSFFGNLAVKHGELTEWQRSQLKGMLRRLLGLAERPHMPLNQKMAPAALPFGPPPTFPKKETNEESKS